MALASPIGQEKINGPPQLKTPCLSPPPYLQWWWWCPPRKKKTLKQKNFAAEFITAVKLVIAPQLCGRLFLGTILFTTKIISNF